MQSICDQAVNKFVYITDSFNGIFRAYLMLKASEKDTVDICFQKAAHLMIQTTST